ncbi:MAG: hypothetical protein ABFS14_11300 [Gemmatimonadota bacterium]
MRTIVLAGSLLLPSSLAGQEAPGKPDLLPLACESAIALAAAPPHLRAEATVYVLGETGFETVHEGSNGFACIVNRDHPRVLKPTCFDAEGARTIVPKILFFGQQLMAGKSVPAIRSEIASGFEDGTFVRPGKAGVAYMLSNFNRPYNRQADRLGWFPPHYMFYAPDLTTADLGTTREARAANSELPFVAYQGPHGFVVMMAQNRSGPDPSEFAMCPAWVSDGLPEG